MAMKAVFGEVNLFVTDLERSLAFYVDVLGFETLGEERGAVHLKGAGHRFLLLPFAKPNASPAGYGAFPQMSFDLEVADINGAFAHCKAAGVSFERELEPGGYAFFVKDPDGLVIEIISVR